MSAQTVVNSNPNTDNDVFLNPVAPVLGRINNLETRLARSMEEVEAAQSLRYAVFYEELHARPQEINEQIKRDQDELDRYCDHLLVLDTAHKCREIVGTYRMMRQSQANKAGRFYTQSEFNLSPLLKSNLDQRVLELGRSCIQKEYRSKRTMELLWHGTWAHAVQHKIDIMFGCASFEGTNPAAYSTALSWLADNAVLPPDENCPALAKESVGINSFVVEQSGVRQAMAVMPPLLKGYLRLGAQVGSDLVIDHQFGTIDILVVLKVANISSRYLAHFGSDASRFAN